MTARVFTVPKTMAGEDFFQVLKQQSLSPYTCMGDIGQYPPPPENTTPFFMRGWLGPGKGFECVLLDPNGRRNNILKPPSDFLDSEGNFLQGIQLLVHD